MNFTFISSQPWNQPWFQKDSFCTSPNQPWFQSNYNFSQVNNIHNISLVSSEDGENIIISNDSVQRFSCRAIGVLIVFVKNFKDQFCIFSQRSRGVPWLVLLSKQCLCKWEEYNTSERATLTTERIWVREWEELHLRLPCTFHASDSIHQQSFQILSFPWSYHSSPSDVFLHQHGENEPMFYIRAEEMYQPLNRKSLKTMKLKEENRNTSSQLLISTMQDLYTHLSFCQR